jgi:hypothetical protein
MRGLPAILSCSRRIASRFLPGGDAEDPTSVRYQDAENNPLFSPLIAPPFVTAGAEFDAPRALDLDRAAVLCFTLLRNSPSRRVPRLGNVHASGIFVALNVVKRSLLGGVIAYYLINRHSRIVMRHHEIVMNIAAVMEHCRP